jgi:hypothetical protein
VGPVARVEEMRYPYKILARKPEGRKPRLKDIGVDGRIRTSGGSLWTRYKHSDPIKGGIS